MEKLQFSGHESFHCRQFWLKKGFDFIKARKKFSDESAVIDLGVGKNMVLAIRHWMKAFDLIDSKENLTELSKKIFDKKGWDPFLEDEGTLWLLHYHLTKAGYASIFKMVFSDLRKQKPEFSRQHFYSLVANTGSSFSETTLSKDFTVFLNTYVANSTSKSDIEDSYSGILTELNLVSLKKVSDKETLVIESRRRPQIPPLILLYCIADSYKNSLSINVDQLFNDRNGVGTIFALNKEGLVEKLEDLTRATKDVTFKNDAGVRELQFKKKVSPLILLEKYYGS